MNLMAEHARQLVNMPADWEVYDFEAIGGTPAKLIRVTGAIAPFKTRGKGKGQRNWKKRDKSTERTAYFTPEEHRLFLECWEKTTGKCSACIGTGEVFARWSVDNGTEYKPCSKCGATGTLVNK